MSEVPVFQFALTSNILNNKELLDKNELCEEDFLPTRSDPEATGWDVRCAKRTGFQLKPEVYIKVPLGFRIFSPPGWWLKLVPRSSTFNKRHIHALYGTIDETYEGEAFFCGQFIPDAYEVVNGHNYAEIKFGDRIGQLIPVRREEMIVKRISNEEFDKLAQARGTLRGAGGFGSTGVK